jgi:glycosyltransferase involved in cell wall biosynthesis
MDEPLVTIIIPSFNHGEYLEEAIQSVLNQTYQSIELIIVDDGSTDNSHEVASRYADHPKVKVILNNENRGQSAVINQALEIANGEFVSFLPSDDWYLPEKTELQVKKFGTLGTEYGVVYGKGARYFSENGVTQVIKLPTHRGNVLKEMLTVGNFVYPITPMFRRTCLASELFDERFKALGEAIYNVLAIDHKFDFIDAVVGVMRNHGSNVGKDPDLRIYQDSLTFWEEFFDRSELPRSVRRFKGRRIGKIHKTKGLSRIIYHRDYRQGRRILFRAIKSSPKFISDPKVWLGLSISLMPRGFANRVLNRRYG